MRTVVPPRHKRSAGTSEASLMTQGLPLAVARRVARNPALLFVGTHPHDVVRMALSDLQSASLQGLDLVELRAVFAALPPVMTNDDAKGSKAAWLRGVQTALEAMTRQEEAGSLVAAKARNPCYKDLETTPGGCQAGPFDPDVPLEATQAVKSSAFEPTRVGQGQGGGGGDGDQGAGSGGDSGGGGGGDSGGGDGTPAAGGGPGHVAAMRAAFLESFSTGAAVRRAVVASASVDAAAGGHLMTKAKGPPAGVALLRGRQASAEGKVGDSGGAGSGHAGGGGASGSGGSGTLMAELAAAAARREAREGADEPK